MGALPFEFEAGLCKNINERLYVCASKKDQNTCFTTTDLQKFDKMQQLNKNYINGAIGSYNGSIMLLGGDKHQERCRHESECEKGHKCKKSYKKAEYGRCEDRNCQDQKCVEWWNGSDFIHLTNFPSPVKRSSTITVNNILHVFGKLYFISTPSGNLIIYHIIYRIGWYVQSMKSFNVWSKSKFGLHYPRARHTTILLNNQIFHIGGYHYGLQIEMPIEKWILKKDGSIGSKKTSKVYDSKFSLSSTYFFAIATYDKTFCNVNGTL